MPARSPKASTPEDSERGFELPCRWRVRGGRGQGARGPDKRGRASEPAAGAPPTARPSGAQAALPAGETPPCVLQLHVWPHRRSLTSVLDQKDQPQGGSASSDRGVLVVRAAGGRREGLAGAWCPRSTASCRLRTRGQPRTVGTKGQRTGPWF